MSSFKHSSLLFAVCGSNAIDQYTVPLNTKTGTNWALAAMAATLGTNILCTALIVARIIYVARGHHGIMGGIRTYRGVIEIVVESAALYSITFVVWMILYPLKGNGYMYPEAMVLPVTVRLGTSIYIVFCLTSL